MQSLKSLLIIESLFFDFINKEESPFGQSENLVIYFVDFLHNMDWGMLEFP